ncbi:hypothetical protein F0223_11575 [Vibrio coralliilyticus]|uniref:immunity protein TriTu family protein n=1 Tax=Vibrio TaxID=662 RepID=UPI00050199B0|nr:MULTISPECIES: hypothetical protein [Vibrio]KFI11666.1 hypothetical protein IX95_11555 [Vibrio sp. B183]NOI18875.1 hypothetical protein [Vibrio coralliilyticus]
MLKKVANWLESNENIFKEHGCQFEVLYSPEESKTKSMTIDFEYESYYCRLIFWDTGRGHAEFVDIETEVSIIDQSFDVSEQLETPKPFENFLTKMDKY